MPLVSFMAEKPNYPTLAYNTSLRGAVEDVDLDMVCGSIEIHYADGTSETYWVQTVKESNEFEDWTDLDWDTIPSVLEPFLTGGYYVDEAAAERRQMGLTAL